MARLEWDSPARPTARPTATRGRNGTGIDEDLASIEWKVDPFAASQERHLRLDAITDPHHWSYKVPGAVVLACLLAFLAVAVYDTGKVSWIVQILGLYLLIRFLLVVAFYPVGQWRIHQLQRRPPQTRAEALATPVGLSAPVHHVVILANFKEPEDVVARTLERLGQQDNARETLTVVMAMEDAEAGSRAKGERLKARYGDRFAHMLVTVHPAGLPGEAPGKASNQAWAARIARDYLTGKIGIPLDSLTVTSCDADSLIHLGYFAELTRQFAADSGRHERIWQAPFRFNNNIWRSPAPIRLLGFLNNMVQISELSNPLSVNLPLSTYTLSYRLAEEVGYWDEMVIAEDWHIFLRCLFGSGGRVTLKPIFLPTSGDSVSGATMWQAFAIFFKQRVRHAWGASDIGYILQQWNRWPDVPLRPKVMYLSKVLNDHIVFTVAGLLLGVGSILTVLQNGLPSVVAPIPGFYAITIQTGNLLSAGGTLAAWLYEHITSRRASPGWRPSRLLFELLTWPLLAPVTLALVIAPTFEAQFRQLFGGDLVFWRTPKRGSNAS